MNTNQIKAYNLTSKKQIVSVLFALTRSHVGWASDNNVWYVLFNDNSHGFIQTNHGTVCDMSQKDVQDHYATVRAEATAYRKVLDLHYARAMNKVKHTPVVHKPSWHSASPDMLTRALAEASKPFDGPVLVLFASLRDATEFARLSGFAHVAASNYRTSQMHELTLSPPVCAVLTYALLVTIISSPSISRDIKHRVLMVGHNVSTSSTYKLLSSYPHLDITRIEADDAA